MANRNLDATPDERVPKGRLILVLAAVLAVLLLAGFSYYASEEAGAYEKIGNELKTIAVLKSTQIADWYQDELRDADLIAANGILTALIDEWKRDDNGQRLLQLERYLTSLKMEHGYRELFLYTPDGNRIIAPRHTHTGVNDEMLSCVNNVLARKRAQATTIYDCGMHDTLHIDIVALVRIGQASPPILLVCRFAPSDVLFPLLDRWPIERSSAESFLIKAAGDSLLVQSNLRFRPASAASLFLPISDTALAVVRAFQSRGQLSKGLDYRGAESFTFVHDVPGSPWALATAINRGEALQGFHSEVLMIIGYLILILFILIIGLAWYYSHRKKILYRSLSVLHQELMTLLDSMADAVIITGTDSRITHFNPAAEQLTGWSAREVIGKNFDDICTLIHEHTGNPVESPISRALRQNMAEGFANGLLLVSADGNKIPVMESIAAIREKEHTIFGVAVLFKDQTEQRIRQRLLEDSELKYRSLFETTSDAIALWQVSSGENESVLDATLLDCNERFAASLGSVSTELTGRPLQDCSVFDTDVILPLLRNIVASRTPSVTEVHAPTLRRYFNVTLYTPADDRVAMMLHDITEQKNAEITLLAKIEELERFNHLVVDRELRMIELKQEVNALLQSTGRPEKYRIIT